jgi:hypothetical protein
VLEEFRSFVNDAAVFVRHFGMAMAKSAPHIYLSALPFAPTCSPISTHFRLHFLEPYTWNVDNCLIGHH